MAEEGQQTKKSSKTGYLDSYIQRIVKGDEARFGGRSITAKAVSLLNRLSLALIEKITDAAIKAVLAEGSRTIGVENLRQIVYILFPQEEAVELDRTAVRLLEGDDGQGGVKKLLKEKATQPESNKHSRIAMDLEMKIPPVRIAQLIQATAKRIPIVSDEGARKKKATEKPKEGGKPGGKTSKKIRVAKLSPYYFASIVESILMRVLDSAKELLEKDVKRITPAEIQMALEQDNALRQALHTLRIKIVGAGLYDQFVIETREMMAEKRGEKATGEKLTKAKKEQFERERKQIENVTEKRSNLNKLTMFSQVATVTNITKQIVYSLSADVKRISEQFRLALGLYVEKELFDVAKLAVRTATIRGRATVSEEDLLFPAAFEGYRGQLSTLPRDAYVKAGTEGLFDKYVGKERVSLRKPQISNIFKAAGANRVGAIATQRLMLYADYLFEKYVTAAFRAAEVADAKTIGLWALLLQLEVSGITLVYLLRKDTKVRVKNVATVARRKKGKGKAEGAAATATATAESTAAPKRRGRPSGSGKGKTKTAASGGTAKTTAAGAKKRGRPPKAAASTTTASSSGSGRGRKTTAKK